MVQVKIIAVDLVIVMWVILRKVVQINMLEKESQSLSALWFFNIPED